MAEYSRMASGQIVSNGVSNAVVLPFIPNYIEISNKTRLAAANSGVSRAWWETDMGQGAAFLTTTTNAASDLSAFIDATGGSGSTNGFTAGTGFTTIEAGLALQYGPIYQHTGSSDFSISKAATAVVTCTSNHNLVTGDVVIFSNLYQTSTTGMQQIAGIPFVITRTGATTFTIPWDTSGSNYTVFNSATATNNVGSWKKVLYPALYAPGIAFISAVTTGNTTTITTTSPHNFVVGQEVGFRIPSTWGPSQLNELPNVLIPGSPVYGYVVSVTNSTTFVVNINSSGYTAFNANQAFAGTSGRSFPQVVAVGDVNTGGLPISAGSQLYPSPQVFNGYTSSTSVGVNTINGPAIQGAYINATFQGFVIGSAISGTASDVIYWRAYMHDINT